MNWPMVLIAVLLLIIHSRLNRGISRKSWYYLSGILLFLSVTVTPIDHLGHHYLFSAHMIQHIVILLMVPPLLLLGTDEIILSQVNLSNGMRKALNTLVNPVVAWLLGMGTMWFWHIPSVFVSMKDSHFIHILHLISLLVFGIIFIWPVFSPLTRKRLSPLSSVLYLFTACVGCTLLGIFLTFSDKLYYIQAFRYESMITGQNRLWWQLPPVIDQQVAGLIMWVPACFIYITNSMVILARWMKAGEVHDYNTER